MFFNDALNTEYSLTAAGVVKLSWIVLSLTCSISLIIKSLAACAIMALWLPPQGSLRPWPQWSNERRIERTEEIGWNNAILVLKTLFCEIGWNNAILVLKTLFWLTKFRAILVEKNYHGRENPVVCLCLHNRCVMGKSSTIDIHDQSQYIVCSLCSSCFNHIQNNQACEQINTMSPVLVLLCIVLLIHRTTCARVNHNVGEIRDIDRSVSPSIAAGLLSAPVINPSSGRPPIVTGVSNSNC